MSRLHPPISAIRSAVRTALEEDIARGDVTTEACVSPRARGRALLRAREPLVLSGVPVAREVYAQLDPSVRVLHAREDGEHLRAGETVVVLEGPATALLMGERTALNFVQRLSGVATRTRAFVQALPPRSRTRIADTRKTTPGLRRLERYAVRCGGGHNHREDLGAAVMIKDNHIAACGGIGEAIARARAFAPHTSRITCEVDNEAQLHQALDAGADIVLLDNFDDAALPGLVEHVAGRALVEVSGGVHLGRVARIAAAGVDIISVGALTHSAPSVDLGLDWDGRS